MASIAQPWRLSPECSTILIFATIAILSHLTTTVAATDNSVNNNDKYHEVAQFQHFNEPFDERVFGQVKIELIDVTPSSIEVKWRLTNRTHADSVVEFTFLLETSNGRIVSHKLHDNFNSFKFEFLSPETKYLVCVHLLEKSVAKNASILHYSCESFSTIPVMRLDSVLGVVLTAAYFVLMVVLGYLAWYRRVRKSKCNDEEKEDEEEERFRIEDNESVYKDDYYQFVKAAGRGGFANYTVADERAGDADGVNGDAAYKGKSVRGDCSGTCIPFTAKEEENLVEYNAKMREISF